MRNILILIFTFSVGTACKTKYIPVWVKPEETRIALVAKRSLSSPCTATQNYIPFDEQKELFSERQLNVVIHFMNSQDSLQNYTESKAKSYAEDIVHSINNSLSKNRSMTLPEGNATLNLDPYYKVTLNPKIKNVFCHYDDEMYFFVKQGKNRNNYSREVISKYAVSPDSNINIFIMPHHPDSIKSKSYFADGSGITLGTSIKVAGLFENGGPASNYRGLISHEIGHVLGLRHAWGNDPCDDTPKHNNCWARTGTPPCDGPTSNNLMDYNPFQNAITPCQLGIVHRNLIRERSRARKLVIPTWCSLDSSKTVTISDSVIWNYEVELEGNVDVLENGYLEISCRTSIPENGRITVYPGGKLVVPSGKLHNSCDRPWIGIQKLQNGNLIGEVEIGEGVIIENCHYGES